MPLTMAKPGETVTIRKITGKDEVRQHLAELGFVVDEFCHGGERDCGKSDSSGEGKPYRAGQNIGEPCDDLKEEPRMKTLKDAKVGETVRVKKLYGEGPVKRRIMDMGITKGVDLHVRKVAPLGDPMELNVRGYELSVRKADAEMIEVE